MNYREPISVTHPQVAKEWDYEKNGELTPLCVTKGQTKKVWWRCIGGHSYEARIDHRCSMNSGCPYCAGKKVLQGVNDLKTLFPQYAEEWDYSNNDNPPENYASKSNKTVSWLCPICKRSYSKKISDRTIKGLNCPSCFKESQTSFQEQTILFYVSKVAKAENRIKIHGYETDIYLPKFNIGIEYNGEYFHENKSEHDKIKRLALAETGVRLITLECTRERKLINDTISLKTNYKSNPSTSEFEWGLSELFKLLDLELPDVDIERDRQEIYSLYVKSVKDNNLVNKAPDIAEEWDNELNKGLCPEAFSIGSSKKVWWKCKKCGNSYETPISRRTSGQKSGCPYCANKSIIVGFNDLATTNPELAKEWDDEKNGSLTPQEVAYGSSKKVWWKCELGHSWEAAIYSRKECGCPVCTNRQVLKGFNDLATIHPELSKIWNHSKNEKSPAEYTSNSNHSVWWKCDKCGHEWKAMIYSITCGGRCPKCATHNRTIQRQNTILAKKGSLAETNPKLAREWDYDKNGDLTPNDVTAGSDKKVWWRCEKNHSWQAVISSRKRNGCPICGEVSSRIEQQKTRLRKSGTLAECRPDLVAEWDHDKNGTLTPDKVTPGSTKRVWWKCKHGHSWEAVIYSRKKAGCPICSGRKAQKGYNDLTVATPHVLDIWNYERNDKGPEYYTKGSHKKVWWKCNKCSHEWEAEVKSVVSGTRCPYCAGRK